MRNARSGGFGALIVAALLTSSCSNPEQEKMRHVQLGDQYVAEKRDEFAVVEYASAVKIDPKFGEARFKLAEAYERMGNLRAAFPEYIRAADAMPANREAQFKATRVLLRSGQFEDAKARAAALLTQNPKDVEAMLLHANAMAALRDPAGAIQEIEEALKISPESSRTLVNLGAIRAQSGDTKEAEAAFRKAIALEPSSADAKLALASFLMANGRMPEAEATIKETLANEPQHLLANRMLAGLYLASGRPKEAEPFLKTMADVSKAPAVRFQLADYYVSVGRNKDATDLLVPLAADQPTFADAELRLATLDYTEGRVAEAHKRLDNVVGRVPNRGPALVIKARWLTTENKLDEALEVAKAAVAADADAATAHYALGVVHDRRREFADAVKSYNEVLRLNPRATAAQVALSRLSLTSGAGAEALRYAEDANLGAPANLAARVALAKSLLAAGNLARAETEIAVLLKGAPNAPAAHALNGSLQAAKNNVVAARQSFERALQLLPGSVDALTGLTLLDLRAKTPAQAVARLESEIAKRPNDAALLVLAAQAYNAAGNQVQAEQALRRAVSVDPGFTDGYTGLAQLFMKQGRLEDARLEFERVVARNPSAVGPRTMVGALLEAQGKRDEARRSYEATVSRPEKAPVAANNLAYIYAEQGTNLDVALGLATSAKQQMPDDPGVDDTLGWIYYKKDLPSLAVGPLQESLKKLPNNAEVMYHLGLTYAKLGDNEKAREMLTRSLKLDPKIGGDEARRALASVSK
jgi:tetratricopeptide (TPR) repeat protein